jgi:hypothetical protein
MQSQQALHSNFHFGSVRTPIQCEGIERGHRRIAAIGVSGSVNPQSFWSSLGSTLGDIGKTALKTAPIWAPLLL